MSAPEVRAASRGVYLAFILLGFAGSSWAARIPQVRDALGLTPSGLGLVLLAIAAGSIVALLLAGQAVARFSSRRIVLIMCVVLGLALIGAGTGYLWGVAPLVIALFFFGVANGAWDVAMNVQGALVERRLGRSIMPRYHAGFSVGTVSGALVGVVAVAAGFPVTAHLIVSGVLTTAVVLLSVRTFLPDEAEPAPAAAVSDPTLVAANAPVVAQSTRRRTLSYWREPRTVLIGIFVLAFALTEGAGIDWISVAMIDGYGAAASIGTLAFAVFLTAMTVGRWFGPILLDRYGRVPVLRVLACVSLAGLGLFILSPSTPLAFVGALCWGLGASLGFPVGMSAAADDPAHAAPRVGVVASIGYCAFLAGPPVIGFLGDHVTVLRALGIVALLIAVAIALAGAVREPVSAHTGTDEPASAR